MTTLYPQVTRVYQNHHLDSTRCARWLEEGQLGRRGDQRCDR
jgi:hypothetical protein